MIEKKIIAIGGGECGRITSSGVETPYETAEIDEEIIRISGKEKPRALLLAHAQSVNGAEYENKYYETMERIYGGRYGCETRRLMSSDLTEGLEKAKEYVGWADIVYEGGGDTAAMLGLWRRTGFDAVLKDAWGSGKVMCGLSAGAICWFALGNTDSPGYREKKINKIPALGFVDAYFSPHCQAEWKRESEIRSLKYINKVGLSVSNCAAVEIVGGKYRVITSSPADSAFRPYVLRTFWRDGVMREEELKPSDEFAPLDGIIAMR